MASNLQTVRAKENPYLSNNGPGQSQASDTIQPMKVMTVIGSVNLRLEIPIYMHNNII